MKLVIYLILLTFLAGWAGPLVFAQDNPSVVMPPQTLISPTPASIDYTLPYPGILPDNPLYGLKTLRDNVIGWLIASPIKKATFDVLQSDKRLQSGVFLVAEDKHKTALAISTISKGQNYMLDAISRLQEAKKQGLPIHDLGHKMHQSSAKEVQVLQQLQPSTDQSEQAGFKLLQQRANDLVHKTALLDPVK